MELSSSKNRVGSVSTCFILIRKLHFVRLVCLVCTTILNNWWQRFSNSASTDSKWYQWIEEQFNVSIATDRKIDFEQFRKALHLGKVPILWCYYISRFEFHAFLQSDWLFRQYGIWLKYRQRDFLWSKSLYKFVSPFSLAYIYMWGGGGV